MHPILGAALSALALIHVLAAFLFALVHGASAYAMWQLRREREPARASALLDMSGVASGASWIAVGLLALSGALLASTAHLWARAWVWGSAIVFAALGASMSVLAARPFNHARHALGLKWFDGRRTQPATGLVDQAAFERALEMVRARAPAVMVTGVLGLGAMVWLMVARPG